MSLQILKYDLFHFLHQSIANVLLFFDCSCISGFHASMPHACATLLVRTRSCAPFPQCVNLNIGNRFKDLTFNCMRPPMYVHVTHMESKGRDAKPKQIRLFFPAEEVFGVWTHTAGLLIKETKIYFSAEAKPSFSKPTAVPCLHKA